MARAQIPRRIVVLSYAPPEEESVRRTLRAFREGLAAESLAEGRDYAVEVIHAPLGEGLPRRVREALKREPALLVALTTPVAQAVARETRAVPIVFGIVSDPVGSGLVASLPRPGGNVTGISNMLPALSGKVLELLLELIPGAARVAVLWNPDNPAKLLELQELRAAARTRGVALRELPARSAPEIETALAGAAAERVHALLILAETLTNNHRRRIAELSLASRLPVVANNLLPIEAGGLASYAPDYTELSRRMGAQAAKILRGTKPSELPVELPAKFQLAVNLKTARTLGLTVPRPVLLRADKVIE